MFCRTFLFQYKVKCHLGSFVLIVLRPWLWEKRLCRKINSHWALKSNPSGLIVIICAVFEKYLLFKTFKHVCFFFSPNILDLYLSFKFLDFSTLKSLLPVFKGFRVNGFYSADTILLLSNTSSWISCSEEKKTRNLSNSQQSYVCFCTDECFPLEKAVLLLI